MNLERINKATECIESNEKALKWLRNNHERLVSSGLFTVTVSIDQTFAHTGTGVRQAMETISAFAKHNIEKSIEDSIANCINTIAIERDAIRVHQLYLADHDLGDRFSLHTGSDLENGMGLISR